LGLGYYGMSVNPSISFEFIEKHMDKHWHWGGLSSNEFTLEFKKNKAARVIQVRFLDWFYKPICKDGSLGLNCELAKRLCC
jgi:hypothetical protein